MLIILEASKKAYANDPEKFKEVSKKAYGNDPEKFKNASKRAYANDPGKLKEASKKAYTDDPEKFKGASKKAYANDPEKFKNAMILEGSKKLQRKPNHPDKKKMHQKRLIKRTYRSVNKPLKTNIMSTEKKFVVRKGKNMHCVHPVKVL